MEFFCGGAVNKMATSESSEEEGDFSDQLRGGGIKTNFLMQTNNSNCNQSL